MPTAELVGRVSRATTGEAASTRQRTQGSHVVHGIVLETRLALLGRDRS